MQPEGARKAGNLTETLKTYSVAKDSFTVL
jgi:hypothetical protein